MRSIARDGDHEVDVLRSRFLCRLARVPTVAAAAAVIAAVRKERWSATHHCSAFRVGPHAQEQRSNDDGEPAGTAGVPMLEVLTRRELTDTVAVVTRYYGGIKLGAGGLVRAYGRAVAEAVDAVGTVRLEPHVLLTVTVQHQDAGRLEGDLRASGYRWAGADYGRLAHLRVHVPSDRRSDFDHWLARRTGGRAVTETGPEVLLDVPEG